MIWTVVALFCGAAVLVRILTRRGRRQIWWTCATAAPATSVAAGVILGNEKRINDFLEAPNLAVLLATLFSVVGSALSQIFWYAVRVNRPRPTVILVHAGLGGLIGLTMVGLWLAAPVHSDAYPTFRDVPLSWQMVLYALIFEIYFAACQVRAGVGALQMLTAPPEQDPGLRDPAIRTALYFVLPASTLAVVGQTLYLVRLLFEASTPATASILVGAADLCTLLAMLGYGASGLTALVGPRMAAAVRARRLVASLDPLWRRLRELYPTVALSSGQLSGRASLRAGRMLIEIGDGLALLRVVPDDRNPIRAVARALVEPEAHAATEPAARVLPDPATAREEEQLFLWLSEAYADVLVDRGSASGGAVAGEQGASYASGPGTRRPGGPR